MGDVGFRVLVEILISWSCKQEIRTTVDELQVLPSLGTDCSIVIENYSERLVSYKIIYLNLKINSKFKKLDYFLAGRLPAAAAAG